jgi:glutathione S-transferase
MAPKYVLHYFDLRGRGEPLRWIFHYAGQEFEDHRIDPSQWATVKTTTPQGQLPYLEIDDKQLPESMAIGRYLARQFGIAGQNALEEAQADAIIDHQRDASREYWSWIAAVLVAKDQAKADEIKAKYFSEGLPPYLQSFEKKLQNNSQGQGFLVGNKPTWADFIVVAFFDELERLQAGFLDGYPGLKSHRDRVHGLKGIKEWLAKRKETFL